MNWTKLLLVWVFSLFVLNSALGQGCPSLRDAQPAELVSFLSAAMPDQSNSECIAWAIKTLGAKKYEAALPVLARYLDFKRPPNELEKDGVYLHPSSVWQVYPAAAAFDEFGEKALPTLINVIRSASATELARQNAIAVLMAIHKYETPKGVALLKEEEVKATDDSSKRRLRSAISIAVAKWCGPVDQPSCKVAANDDKRN